MNIQEICERLSEANAQIRDGALTYGIDFENSPMYEAWLDIEEIIMEIHPDHDSLPWCNRSTCTVHNAY